MRNKHVKLLVIAYSVLLIAAAVFHSLIPIEGFAAGISEDEMKNAAQIWDVMLNQIEHMTEEELEKIYTVNRWSFDFTDNRISVLNPDKDEPIIFVNKEVDDKKVEVIRYSSPWVIEGVDFSNVIIPPDVELSEGILKIRYHKQKHSYTRFTKDFTMTQFSENKNWESQRLYGHRKVFVFIKLPKGVAY